LFQISVNPQDAINGSATVPCQESHAHIANLTTGFNGSVLSVFNPVTDWTHCGGISISITPFHISVAVAQLAIFSVVACQISTPAS